MVQRTAFALVAALVAPVAVFGDEAPPSPAAGVDYRVVLKDATSGERIEIRRRGNVFRHEILDGGNSAVIFYETDTGVSTVVDDDAVYILPTGISELAGSDASAMMRGLSDSPVEWTDGDPGSVAGERCREHIASGTREGGALSGRFCVTPDGVVLAISIGGPGQVGREYAASEFARGAQPVLIFDIPRPPGD